MLMVQKSDEPVEVGSFSHDFGSTSKIGGCLGFLPSDLFGPRWKQLEA